jgi:hypothetical protein
MLHKRIFVFTLALLVFTLGFTVLVFAQEATPESTPLPRPDFTVEPEATLDPSRVFVTPFENTVVNIRIGPGVQYRVRGLLRPNRYLEAIGHNGLDFDRPCSESIANDLDQWIQVSFNTGEAWVNRCAVVVEGDLSGLEVPEDVAATAEPTIPEATEEA